MKLFNTLTQKKETFRPLMDNEIRMYTCGPTVYSRAHIGNLRVYVTADVLKQTLIQNGFTVKHVVNITDVGHLTGDLNDGEDKMVKAAQKERKSAWDIAKEYEGWFKKDVADLHIQPPTLYVRATEHIADQIALIQELEKKGFTYRTSDGVYFDTSKLSDYGKLARLDISGLQEGARVKKTSGKKHVTDFALWKFSPLKTQRDMEWDSPWGKGFPGWHIECSAMSAKYLGVPFDIHTGGIDLIPLHHTNEIAQTEAATGKLLAQTWVHSEFLNLHEGKMAKSEGNGLTLDTLREQSISPLGYRYYLLNTHYRQPIEFSWKGVKAAETAYQKLLHRLAELDPPKIGCAELERQFSAALNDDLNAPKGLAVMWELVKSKNPSSTIHRSLLAMDTMLGLGLSEYKQEDLPSHILELMAERQSAREEDDFTSSDLIRKRIEAEGFVVEDTPDGQRVRKKR